jgi:hypothetical protein
VVRLTCLDVFHLDCLNQFCESKPLNTAISGYICPLCPTRILPPIQQTGPLASRVRKSFENSRWAQNVQPNTVTVIPEILIPPIPIQEHSLGIVPSAQFKESKSQSTVLMDDPDAPEYKSKVRMGRSNSTHHWIKELLYFCNSSRPSRRLSVKKSIFYVIVFVIFYLTYKMLFVSEKYEEEKILHGRLKKEKLV